MTTYKIKVFLKSGNILETVLIADDLLDEDELRETLKAMGNGFSLGITKSGRNEGAFVQGESIEALTLTLA